MKGIFTGDWHYGLSVEELDRTPDVDKAVHSIVDFAIQNEVDFFSIGGDLTDNNTPHPDQLAKLIKVCNRLEDAEIPTFITRGNHCAVSAQGRVWALTPLQEIDYNNIHFVTHPKLIKYGDATFLFLPHVTKIDALDAGFKTVQEYINSEAERLITEAEDPVTVISHYNVNGCLAGTEALMLRQSDLQLPGICIRSPKVLKVINSHIHTAQESGKIIMPGSPICTDFGDLESPKGFLVGELEHEKWKFEQVLTKASPMQQFELDFLNKDQAAIAKEISAAVKLVEKDSIVKVRILVEQEKLPTIDFVAIGNGFAQKARFVKQLDKVVMTKRAVRDKNQTTNLQPIDAVKIYLDKREPEGKDRKLQMAMKIIDGQKLEQRDTEAPFLNQTAAQDALDSTLEDLSADLDYPEEFSI